MDILIPKLALIVEFDSYIYHKDRLKTDREKTFRLVQSGWRVIRAREEPLEPLFQSDVVVPQRSQKEVANRVLRTIQDVCGIDIDGLEQYLERTDLINREGSDARIDQLLREREV